MKKIYFLVTILSIFFLLGSVDSFSAPTKPTAKTQKKTPKKTKQSSRKSKTSNKKPKTKSGAKAKKNLKVTPKNIAESKKFYDSGELNFRIGNNGNAIKDYDKAIKLNPNYFEAYFARGYVYYLLGAKENIPKVTISSYQAALKDYDQTIKLNPKYVDAYIQRGIVKEKLTKDKEAMADFNTAIKLDPKNSMAYLSRSMLKIKIKDPTAKDDYSKFLAHEDKKISAK
ncbi:MAG: tetratricopeptide repeat protein [Fusobacteriaceae bacterium]